jgi:uncharacterized membrane protein YkvA (DUF1232 family)
MTTASEQYVKAGAEKVTPKEIEKVVEHADEIRQQFNTRGPLKRFVDDSKLLVSLLKDYRRGIYRTALYGTIAAVAFALIYVFNPFDIIPDVLPFVGAIDDASVIAACLMLIERDLVKYRTWKVNQPVDVDPEI